MLEQVGIMAAGTAFQALIPEAKREADSRIESWTSNFQRIVHPNRLSGSRALLDKELEDTRTSHTKFQVSPFMKRDVVCQRAKAPGARELQTPGNTRYRYPGYAICRPFQARGIQPKG
ncbi:hypothetical protein BDV09DRAFT_161814 [Aspergillus tetrazonus]